MYARSSVSRRSLLRGAAGVGLSAYLGSAGAAPQDTPIRFVDMAKNAGLTFRHVNAKSDQKYLIETMGSGCGWIDYDQNGLFDLYLVNGAATQLFKPQQPIRSVLYTAITAMAPSPM